MFRPSVRSSLPVRSQEPHHLHVHHSHLLQVQDKPRSVILELLVQFPERDKPAWLSPTAPSAAACPAPGSGDGRMRPARLRARRPAWPAAPPVAGAASPTRRETRFSRRPPPPPVGLHPPGAQPSGAARS